MTAHTSERGKKPFSRKTIGVARLSVVKSRPHTPMRRASEQQRENVRVTIKVHAREFYVPRRVPDLAARALAERPRRVRPYIMNTSVDVAHIAVLFSEIRVPTILGRAANLQQQ